MELPPLLHNHSRYVHRPHPPHPRPPNDRNFYPQRHHHHHLHHLPPPPPIPPTESYRPLPPAPRPPPPPPSFNPHQSQFIFLTHQQTHHHPVEDDPRRPPNFDFTRHHSPQPRVSNRILFDEDHPRLHIPGFDNQLPDSRPDAWVDPPRIPPQDRLVRPVPLGLDHEPRHHRPFNNQILVSSYRTVDKYRHDVEGSSRFGDDFNNRFKPNYTEGFLRGRSDNRGGGDDNNDRHSLDHYVSNSRNFAFGHSHVSNPNPPRDFAGNLRNYTSFYDLMSDNEGVSSNEGLWDSRDEHQKRGHARSPSRELPNSQIEMKGNEFGNGDSSRVISARRVPHTYDSGKLNSKGSKESTQRTPRKKLQKKSALLRLQLGKPNNRNRNEEQFFSSAYFDDLDPSTLRGKGPLVFSDHRMGDDREGSPVELDVSFKSNSLVAKAIVAPSSHSVLSDCNLTPRIRKIRKVAVPETDLSDSPLTKLSEGPVESDSSKHVSDCPSSYNNLKQSEKVMDTGSGATCDIGSQPYSNGTNGSPGNSEMKGSFSDKGGNSVGSNGTPLFRIRKKKKSISPLSHVSQPTKKNGDPEIADSSTNSPSSASQPDEGVMHSKKKITTAGMVAVHDVVLRPSLNEVSVLLENNKVDKSPQAAVSEKDATDIDSGRACVPNIKRKRNSSTPPLGSLTPLENKIDKGTINADGSVHELHTISNSDKGTIELQNGSTSSDIGRVDDVSQQSCQNGLPVPLENGLGKEPLEAMVSVGGNVNADMSSLEKIKIHEGPLNTYSSIHDVHNASSSDNGFIKRQEKIIVSDVDAGCKPLLLNQVTVLLENGTVEGFPKAIPSVGGNAINADGSNHDANTTSSSNNALTHSDGKTTVSDGATILRPLEGPSKAEVSAGGNLNVGSGKKCTSKVMRKRKVRNTQLGLSSPTTGNIPVNGVSLAHAVDTTLSRPVKDLISAEEEVMVSGDGNFDTGSQPCTDNNSILHGNSSTNGSSEAEILVGGGVVNFGPNVTSPNSRKKRKVFSLGSSSPVLSHTREGPASVDTSTFCAGVPLNIDKVLTQSEDKISSDTVCSFGLLPCEKQITILLENTVAGDSFEAMDLIGDGLTDNSSKCEQKSPCPSGSEGEQKENGTLVVATTNHQNDIIDTKSGSRGEKIAAASAFKEHGMLQIGTDQHGIPFVTLAPDLDQRLPGLDMECDSYLLVKHDFPSVSNTLSLCADGDGVSTTNSSDEPMNSVPYTPSLTGSTETFSFVSGSHFLNPKLSLSQISNENVCGDDKKQDEKPVSEGASVLFSINTSSQNTEINLKSGQNVNGCSINAKTASFLSQDTKKPTQALTSLSTESSVRKSQLSSAVPKVFPGHSFLHCTTSKKTAPLSHIAKLGTWHRTGNPSASPFLGKNSYSSPVPPQRQLPGKTGKVQSISYIRKGNSLVRKPSLVAAPPHRSRVLSSSVYRLNPLGIDEVKKSTGFESRVDVIDPQSYLRTGLNATLSSSKLANCTTISSGDYASLLLADPPQNGCSETTSDPLKHTGNVDVPKSSEDAPKSFETPENQSDLTNNLESQSVPDEGNLESVHMKKIIYVKRKSNQLVAASNSSDAVQDADKTQSLSSDGYYKRRKNQLIRKSSESRSMQRVAIPDERLILEGQRAPKVIPSRISSKSRPGKGLAKTYKPSKFSLVWTLNDKQSSKKINPLQHQKVWPYLFPWKRAPYWRSFLHNTASISNNRSLSTISRKLLLSRKRDAIYTRSTRGFSLRRSKLLSVGGPSLKWSKSIERNSKKANVEATLAVAAAEKKKREQNGAACVVARTKCRNQDSRERIFRVGSFRVGTFRYKMDPTRRTLQRISDKESCFAALQSEKDAKKSYVPRRLVIGNDEYVRIGNGNKLIRDPKKRTRILASEKVRWSLHTARLRLARKRQYCQFFTRFGKCDKDDGKCPYIHDPSKIAVCTKFLNGSCSNLNCKLTHKVIPERMQDCSYFLQGLCSNESCPYRHVNVSPNASICEGFLRGYCADGNECQKKHSYVCPIFEATGICPKGSKCKLHHPKKRTKGNKRKPSREQKNTQGRYFDSRHIDIAECRAAVYEKHSSKDDDDIFFLGRFTDYISVDVSDEEAGETKDPTRGQTTLCDGDPRDVQVEDIDELIKPIHIMNKNLMTESSAAIDSTSERTASYVSEESNLL